MPNLTGYRTLIANLLVVAIAILCYYIELFDQGTATGLILASLANIGFRIKTTTPIGEPR